MSAGTPPGICWMSTRWATTSTTSSGRCSETGGLLRLDSECMAFRYNSKKGGVTNWGELEVVYDMKPQQAFETICKRLGIKVTYILG